jgi:hypothetical protein
MEKEGLEMDNDGRFIVDLSNKQNGIKLNRRAISSVQIGKEVKILGTKYKFSDISAVNVVLSTLQRLVQSDLETGWEVKIFVVLTTVKDRISVYEKVPVVDVIKALKLLKEER